MLEVAQLVEAPDCDSGCCGFDSHPSTQYIPLVLAAARVSPKHQGGVQIPGGMPFHQDNNSKFFLHKLDVVGSSPTYKNYFIVAQMGERLPKKEILSCIIGVYVSLVDGLVWDQKAASSNLAIPTIFINLKTLNQKE